MSLEEEAVHALKKKGYDITTAESCTGGMIASTLINVSGISEIYKEGYIIGHTGNYLLIKSKGNIEDLNIIKKVKIEKIEYPYCIGK